jgi:2,4-dienoyl-CoA reductase (NADPH2)
MNDILFEPIKIGALEVKNRIFMPAMHMSMCHDFVVTDQLIAFYAERARGGAGMITVGYAGVDSLSANPAHIGAHSDEFLPGLTRLATAIKVSGACASVQINHAGRYNYSFFLEGKPPVAPSAVASRLTGEVPRELEHSEIKATIKSFAETASRVKRAGFDAVEVLAGTGYLISEFLSPLTNLRTDEYGGSLENRMRFGIEVVKAVKEATGDDFPLVVRTNGNDFMPDGIGRDDLLRFAVALEAAGADALSINVGWHEASVPQIITKVPRGAFAYLSRAIKEKVSIPVIAGHRINDPETARKLIADNFCDMAAMGRALIADPDLPNKAQSLNEQKIVHCVACAQGCFDHLFVGKHVECLCNPKAGHELEVSSGKCANPLKVLVVGGGAAGMAAAAAAAEKGHAVTLYEKNMRLGGQLFLAGAPPGRQEFTVLAEDLSQQLVDLNVKVVLNQAVDAELLGMEAPDRLVLATGGEPIAPPIPGAALPHVVQAWDVLAKKEKTGKRVVIIGGGAVGVETALMLAEEGTLSGEEIKFLLLNRAEKPEDLHALAIKGSKQVTLVEMIDKLGTNFGKSTRWAMMQDVKRYAVTTRTAAKVLEITESGLRMECDGKVEELEADTVVLAVGTKPQNPLQEVAEELGLTCHVVGDALNPAMVFDAIHQGFAAGSSIEKL